MIGRDRFPPALWPGGKALQQTKGHKQNVHKKAQKTQLFRVPLDFYTFCWDCISYVSFEHVRGTDISIFEIH